VKFLYKFSDRIFHVHMKDVAWNIGDGTVGVFGGHRFPQARATGTSSPSAVAMINFERIIRALNDIDYGGPCPWNGKTAPWTANSAPPNPRLRARSSTSRRAKIIFDAQFAEASK
jgi:sugar phosphate isomerase/epimerase